MATQSGPLDATTTRRRPRPTEAAKGSARRPRVNSIAEGATRGPGAPKAAAAAEEPAGRTRTDAAGHRNSSGAAEVPEWVRSRFVQVGKAYFFPDGAPAFQDRGRRLTTQSENVELVRSLIHIAKARGWNTVTASGSVRFRQLAWQLGEREGLTVRGYRPSAVERAKASQVAAEGAGPTPPAATAAPEQAPMMRPERRPAEARTSIPLIQGDLLEHGRANFRNEPGEKPSYFVRLRTAKGERIVWGMDLERALRESTSHPKIGDVIGLQPSGSERVTVSRPATNDKGEVVGEEQIRAHRNRWSIERLEVFENRRGASQTLRNASLPAGEAVQRHPELVDAYVHLKAAEALATQRILRPEDRDRFMTLVRSALGSAIEAGDPIPAARLRTDRVPRSKPRTREAHPERTL